MDSEVFRKEAPAGDPEAVLVEAAGLRWLGAAADSGGPRIVGVISAGLTSASAGVLEIERIHQVPATAQAAHACGAALARMHGSLPADTPFGTLPPEHPEGHPALWGPADDQIALGTDTSTSWGQWLATQRMAPVMQRLRGRVSAADLAALEQVCDLLVEGRLAEGRFEQRRFEHGQDDAEASAALVHGDLWNGNLLFTDRPSAAGGAAPVEGSSPADRGVLGNQAAAQDGSAPQASAVHAVLIDPAAHAGHRLDDIAMLHLFGAPFLDEIMSGYLSEHPLPHDWKEWIPVHQLFALAGHWALFGATYREPTLAAAEAARELAA